MEYVRCAYDRAVKLKPALATTEVCGSLADSVTVHAKLILSTHRHKRGASRCHGESLLMSLQTTTSSRVTRGSPSHCPSLEPLRLVH